jgi:hypothetical protein
MEIRTDSEQLSLTAGVLDNANRRRGEAALASLPEKG